MATVERSAVVERPVESVFAFVADLRNHERMLPSTYTDFRVTSAEPSGVGARLEYKIGLMGREHPTATEVAVYQPPSRLVERAVPTTEYTTEGLFAAEGSGTRVTIRTSYRPGGGIVHRRRARLHNEPRSSAKSLHPSLKSEKLSRLRRVSLALYRSPRMARRSPARNLT